MFERVQRGGRNHAGLPHPAAELTTQHACAVDHLARPGEHGADRRAEALREAERDGVGEARDGRGVGLQRQRGVEDARTVQVHGGPRAARDLGRTAHAVQGDRRAATAVLRVLQADQHGPRRGGRRTDDGRHLVGVDAAAVVVGDAAQADPAQRGRADRLVVEDVRLGADDGLVAPSAGDEQREQVRHRAARHVERGLLADALGRGLLEAPHRGVVAQHVVADFGARHRLAHRVGGLGDGVGPQVDHGAAPPVAAGTEPPACVARPFSAKSRVAAAGRLDDGPIRRARGASASGTPDTIIAYDIPTTRDPAAPVEVVATALHGGAGESEHGPNRRAA